MSPLLPLLFLVPAAAQESAPATRAASVEAVAARDLAALHASILASRPGGTESAPREAFAAWHAEARAKYLAFAQSRPATDASVHARMRAAAILSRAEGKPADAAALVEGIAGELRNADDARRPLLAEAAALAGDLRLEAGQPDAAARLYEEAAAASPEGPSGLRAKAALADLAAAGDAQPGRPAPSFEAPLLGGGSFASGSLAGRTALLVFWRPESVRGREEIAALGDAYASLHERGLDVLGVALEPAGGVDSGRIERAVAARGLPWPQAFEAQGFAGPIARRYRIVRLPATVLIDRKGIVRARDLLGADLQRRIEELLAEKSDG